MFIWSKATLIWLLLATVIVVPMAAAAVSPLLAWRDPVYIVAGFAGIAALALLLVQPLLAAGYLPNLSAGRSRKIHRWIGSALVVAVVLHVAALWITSPPDVVDALLFASPTPFSVWGVIAMWAVFVSGMMVALRRRVRLRPRVWRMAHTALAVVIVAGSIVHALLIEGTMEVLLKAVFCALVIAALGLAVVTLRCWGGIPR